MIEWLGYMEHASPDLLGVFAANTGKGGCTIFGEMVGFQGVPWCTTFIFAVHPMREKLGKPCPGVLTLARRMALRGRWRGRRYKPKYGDLVFCRNKPKGRIEHCGIVLGTDGEDVISIDGNTVDPSGTFRPKQGGAVALRTRNKADPVIVGYGAIHERT